MAIERGVIYYKLGEQQQYDGDYTKNCGLTGGEIDSNFHFLRGYDVKSFEVSNDKSKLVLTRLNGEELSIDVHKDLNGYEFDYDKIEGILTITNPNGKKLLLDGFVTEREFRVFGDHTIDGDGTRYNPVTISSIAKTGTFSPAQAYIDVVGGEGILPKENVAKGERYVTRERVSKLGLLYPLSGIMTLQKRLEEIGSEWRVPTKEDWDQLLNISEECEAGKNHDDKTNPTNKYLGLVAGENLKATKFWEPVYRKLEDGEVVLEGERFDVDENGNYFPSENGAYLKVLNSEDRFGFSVYPVGFGDRRGISTIGGFGKWAAFWSATEEDRHQDMFVKVFSHDEKGVEQNSWGRDCYLSLRLVKDFKGNNLNDVEMIDGQSVQTVYVETRDYNDRDKYKTSLIWTKENIGFNNAVYGGVTSKEWEPYTEEMSDIRYYINDWDGTQWRKNELKEGESVVLLREGDTEMHEWRLVNGVLVDTADIIRGELAEDMKMVKERLDNLEERANTVEAGFTELESKVNAVVKRNEEIDAELTELGNILDQEIKDRQNADTALGVRIDEEIEHRTSEDALLQKQINENKVNADNDTIVVVEGSTDEEGVTTSTKISVKLPENGMIKFDTEGLYLDGDFSFGGNMIIND